MQSTFSTRHLLAAALLAAAPGVQAQTLSQWLGPVDGDWNDPLNWSTPDAPNNGGGTTYDVLIAAGGANDYSVFLHTGEAFTIDSLVLDDARATLNIELSDLTAGIIDVRAGKLFTRGDLFNAQLIATGAASPIDWEVTGTTTLHDLRFSADTSFTGNTNSRLVIESSLQIDDGIVIQSDVDTLRFAAGVSLTTDGQATLQLMDDMEVRNGLAAPLQIAAGMTVEIVSDRVEIGGALHNYGTIRATGAGVEAALSPGHPTEELVNFGVIEATNGAFIQVSSTTQQGVLRSTGASTIQLGNTLWSASAELQGDGTIYFSSGTLDLDGNTLDLNMDPGGQFSFFNGTVTNGTVTGTGDTVFDIGSTGGAGVTFDGMTFGIDLQVDQRTHNVTGGLTLLNNAVIETRAENGTVRLRFNEAQTVGGSGRIRMGTQGAFGAILEMGQASGAVFFDTGIFIDALTGSGVIGNDDKEWLSRGTIAVGTGQTLVLDGDWANEGTLILENNSYLSLKGNFRTDALGTVLNQGGQIFIDGDLDNRGDVLDLLFLPGEVVLGDGTIVGGTVQSSGNSTLILTDHVRLDRVTFDLTPTPARAVSFTEFIEINDHFVFEAIDGVGRDAGLYPVDGDGDDLAHLRGTGTITFIGNPNNNGVDQVRFAAGFIDNLSGLVIDPGLTVMLDDPDVLVHFGARLGFINRGTIDLSAGFATFGGDWLNEGELRVSGTAEVTLRGRYTTADLLSIDYLGGTVLLTEELDNTGAVLRKDASTFWDESTLPWHSALDITGGRIETGDDLSLTNILRLNGVTIAGDVWMSRFETVEIDNGMALDGGTLHIIGRDTELVAGDITGNGVIQLDDSGTGLPALDFDHAMTVAAGVEIRTGNIGGSFGSSGTAWTNLGTLNSITQGLNLKLSGDVTHHGTAHAENGGVITFETLINHGILSAQDAGIIRLEDGWTNPAGQINLTDGGILAVEAWSPTPGTFVLSEGVVRVEFDTDIPGLAVFPQQADSFLDIAAELDLAAATLDLDSLTSTLRLDGGTLRDGSVVGTAPFQITNAVSPASTLDAILVQTDVQLGDTGTTHLRNATAFVASAIAGDGELRIDTGHTATFDATTIGSQVVIDRGATMAVNNGLTLDGAIRSGTGSGATPRVVLTDTPVIDGNGAITASTSAGLLVEFAGDLTVGPEVELAATSGTLNLSGGTHTLDLQGRLTVGPARSASITVGQWTNHGSTVVYGLGSLNVTADTVLNNGAIELVRGTLNVGEADITNAAGALFAGKGVVNLGNTGTFHQHGDLEVVQASDARLLFLGSLDTQDTANTRITFANFHSDTFAHIQATGDVTLDGQLTLDSESLFTIEAGDTLTLVLGDTLSGVFDTVTGLQIDPQLHWHMDYQSDRLIALARLSGDASGDGFVGVADLEILLANWGQEVLAGDTFLGEWSGDGTIGSDDLQVVLDHWGAGSVPDGNDVPEPGTLALLSLMLFTTHRRRRTA